MVDSKALTQVLHDAKDIAQRKAHKLTSAHLLLAFFTVDNPAQLLLKEKGVDEALLHAMTEPPEEEAALVRELCTRAREIAARCNSREADCLHLLIAFTRTRCGANDLLARAGVDLVSLGNTALSYFTSGRMPRKLQAARTQTLAPRNPLGRPLGAPPSPLPSSAIAVSLPRPSPGLPKTQSQPALHSHALVDEVHRDAPSPPPTKGVEKDEDISRRTGKRPSEHVDVLIVTAVKDEYDAVRKVDTGALSEPWVVKPGPTGLDVAFREFHTAGGEKLRIAVTRALDTGDLAAVNAAVLLVHTYTPRCIAMSGVCAGRRGYVEQGDVIVASRLWKYDTGGLTSKIDESGQRVERVQGEVLSYNIPAAWLQKAESFSPPLDSPWLTARPRTYAVQMDWMLERILEGQEPSRHPARKTMCADYTKVLDLLWKKEWLRQGALELTEKGRAHIQSQLLRYPDGLPEPLPFRVHVGPIGTGSQVIRDPDIFDKLADKERKLLGLEMEASAIGAIAHLHGVSKTLVMKGVMDFADFEKDDHFKLFAARASSECLIAFLREHLS